MPCHSKAVARGDWLVADPRVEDRTTSCHNLVRDAHASIMTPPQPGVHRPLVLFLAVAVLCLLTPAFAVQRSLAGVIDWHKPLIGIARPDLEPVMSKGPSGGSEVWVATRSNVLAVLDGETGNISELRRCRDG